jgi:flagellar assembly protein FliH
MVNIFKSDSIQCIQPENVALDLANPLELSHPELLLNSLDSEQQIREELLSLAKKEGYAAGLEAGLSQATQAWHEDMQSLKNLILNIPIVLTETRLSLQEEISHILLIIVKKYFMQLQLSPIIINSEVRDILEQLSKKQSIELILHSKDIALLQQQQLIKGLNQEVRIRSDDSLALGGCYIRTNHGLFDASLERQIDDLKEALLSIRKEKQDV